MYIAFPDNARHFLTRRRPFVTERHEASQPHWLWRPLCPHQNTGVYICVHCLLDFEECGNANYNLYSMRFLYTQI